MFLPILRKSTDEVIKAFTTELISLKDEFQVLNIENLMNNIHQFPKIEDVLEVAKVDTILSKFQVANEEVKTKVKRYLQSSQGNLALVIFDFSSITINIEKDFEEAIVFVEVREKYDINIFRMGFYNNKMNCLGY
jgi:hypothetical protein